MNPVEDPFYRNSLKLFYEAATRLLAQTQDPACSTEDAFHGLNEALRHGTVCGRALGELRTRERLVQVGEVLSAPKP